MVDVRALVTPNFVMAASPVDDIIARPLIGQIAKLCYVIARPKVDDVVAASVYDQVRTAESTTIKLTIPRTPIIHLMAFSFCL